MYINDKIKFSTNIHNAKITDNDKINKNRELQMIPTYLELAEINGKDRFSKNEIKTITESFKYFNTNLSITDTLKELLSIGTTNDKYLTTNEIKDFLEAASGLKQIEQKNILAFLKFAKENEQDKITIETIKTSLPYEKFRDHMLHNKFDKEVAKTETDWFSEENIKKRYEIRIENEYRILSNPNFKNLIFSDKANPLKFINKENRIFVESLSKCDDPESAYNVIKTLGVTPSIISSLRALSYAWKISNGNKSLLIALNECFYPHETKQICNYIKENKQNKTLTNNLKYYIYNTKIDYRDGSILHTNLQKERTKFLKEFDLEGKIILKPLVKAYKEDVYPTSPIGRGNKITQGSFEAGKKR